MSYKFIKEKIDKFYFGGDNKTSGNISWDVINDKPAEWLAGNGYPSNDIGNENDYYINLEFNKIYLKDVYAYNYNLVNIFTDSSKISEQTNNRNSSSSYWVAHAINGVINGNDYWQTKTNPSFPTWVKYDFGENVQRKISKFRFKQLNGGIKEYAVQGSNDNITWVNLYSAQCIDNNNWNECVFNSLNTKSYRYFRFIVFNLWPTHSTIQIEEIELYDLASDTEIQWRLLGELGSSFLSELDDIDFTIFPNDGQVLKYDDAIGKWKAANDETNGIGGTPSSYLSELLDVNITNPTNGQILKFNGTKWVAVADPTNTYTTLQSLQDVNISSLSNGQYLKYNQTLSKWIGYTITADDLNINIQDLKDVNINMPTNGQLLAYEQTSSKWKPITVSLSHIQDVDLTTPPTNGQFLSYDSISGKWKPKTVNAIDNISMDDITNVDLTTPPINGQVLAYDINLSKWKPISIIINQISMSNISDVDLSISPILNQVLLYNGTKWVPGTVNISQTGNGDIDKLLTKEVSSFNNNEYAGLIQNVILNENVTQYHIIYYDGNNRYGIASNDNHYKCQSVGLLLESGNQNDIKKVLLKGYIKNLTWNWLNEGSELFLGSNGVIADIKPSNNLNIQKIGYVVNSNTIYFEPKDVEQIKFGIEPPFDDINLKEGTIYFQCYSENETQSHIKMGDIEDIDISGLTNNYILVYDSSLNKWVTKENKPLNIDIDLTIPPIINQVLQFNGSKWVPGTLNISQSDSNDIDKITIKEISTFSNNDYVGFIQNITLNDNILKYKLICYDGNNKYGIATNNDKNKCDTVGLLLESGNQNDIKKVLLKGYIKNTSWNWLNENSKIYLNLNGDLTDLKPDNQFNIQEIGYVVNSNTIYFEPKDVEQIKFGVELPPDDINLKEGTIYFQCYSDGNITRLSELSDVDLSTLQNVNQVLVYNGTKWVSDDISNLYLNNVTNDSQVKRSEMGTNNGVATLDSNGKLNSNQIPDGLGSGGSPILYGTSGPPSGNYTNGTIYIKIK